MIIHNHDLIWTTFSPDKTDAVLVIDTNAMLTFAVPSKGFYTIPRRYTQILQCNNGIKQVQFPDCDAP
jgi:hypothetical protein